MNKYSDIWYTSADGLRLYARDYSRARKSEGNQPTILCLHGLTRNSADFEDICDVLSDRYRLVVVDQRGRGRSQYDPDAVNYNPSVYVQDMFLLLEQLGLESVIVMGTSMGGIIGMIMAMMKPEAVAALIINDIGPEVAKEGLDRLKKYVGKSAPVVSWEEAAKQCASINAIAFPNASDDFWHRFAKRTYREDSNGCPSLAYDSAISAPLNDDKENSAAPDLWPVFEKIVAKPMLLIRGELSDILDKDCVVKMQQLKPDLEFSEIPNVGHAPLLNETEAQSAIQKFLIRLA